jgi:hypothetical protein
MIDDARPFVDTCFQADDLGKVNVRKNGLK